MEEKYLKEIQEIKRKHTKANGCIDKKDIYHKEIDNVLLDIIKDLGYTKIVEEYEKAKEEFYYI